jgi:polyhydroxyalkanoate synthesis regulator phasin
MDRLTKAQMEFMNGYVPASIDDIYEYAAGGGIHIKDSKKGTFTAAATKHGKSVQAFASQVLANKDNYSPAMVKKANFARNASKWKHAEGGSTGEGDEVIQQIAQALQKGAKPEKILEELVKMGVSQEEAAQVIQAVMKQLQGTQMQEGGSAPQELTGQEQPQGDDQLMQGIQQALQQGAAPEELIAELIQQQVDPQMIVQIFVQLGMPEEQVVQVVQAVMEQMGGGQEQEVPQEQMQEQGMEEPMQESMEYGGVPEYPYGGLYANDYTANFMPDGKVNRFLTNTNMLSDPSLNYKTQGMAAAGFKPAIALEGIKGIASMFAGSAAGYKGAFNKLFGDKKKPGEITTPQAQAYYSKYFKNANDTFAKKMEAKHFDTPKINPFGQNTSIPSMATPPFNPNRKKFGLGFMHGGELPHAQVGIPPGFVEGMGVGQEGYGGADNSMYNYDPNAQTAADRKLYDDQQALGAAGQNTISISDKKLANDQGEKDGYAFPRYAPKKNSKTLDTSNTTNTLNPIGVSGNTMFTNSMTGLGAVSNFIDMFDTDPETLQRRAIKKANEDYMNSLTYNPANPFGERTPNAGILKPNMRTVQDVGSSQYVGRYGGATRYANGGQIQYQQGGEYHVTQDELIQLMQNGAEVEFL